MSGNLLNNLSLWEFIKFMVQLPFLVIKDVIKQKKKKDLDSGSSPE